ncbi:MAG: TatD family hydrolase [Bacteroidales bacterium]|nr:TatD family hydrolase [Bacteroidales bacterium]
MQFVDTHTHLYDEAFEDGCDAAVERAVEAGVVKMILPDTDRSVRDRLFALADRHPGVAFPCLGLHPTEIPEDWKADLDDLMNYKTDLNVVAIGEIGMDLHWSAEKADLQQEVFRIQLDLALERRLPVIIHNRDATKPIMDVLQDYRGRGLRGVFHAFSGSYETFCEIERIGDFYIGIGGVVTFPKASIAETVSRIPLDRILTETDSPYLTPVPFRGKRNESSYIPYIAAKIAAQKGLDTETVAEAAWNNAHELFKL